MKVSVIVPVYNVEKYLAECLDSILKQDFDEYEVICVEDCSTDNSKNILVEYENKYPQMKCIYNEKNKGLSGSRNAGIKQASGNYIMFVDSDDWIDSNAIEFLVKFVEREAVDVLYYCDQPFFENGVKSRVTVSRNSYKKYENVIYSGKELLFNLMSDNICNKSCAQLAFINREFLINNILFFDERIIHEDVLFYFLCLMKAKRVSCVDKQLYHYRCRAGSITDVITPYRAKSMWIVIIEIFNYWKNNTFDEHGNVAVKRYLSRVIRLARKYTGTLENVKLCFENPADQFFYEQMTGNIESYSFCKFDLEILKEYKKIWIYGGGSVGIEVLQYLKQNGILPQGFCVSKRCENKQLCGLNIVEFSDIKPDGNDFFIVAVTDAYKNEIENTLIGNSINNYLTLDF